MKRSSGGGGRPQKPRREMFECPHCGADVMIGAKVCRECGSDAGTGWQSEDDIDYAKVDIPDGYGGDDDSTAIESKPRPWWWIAIALLLALCLLLLALRR
jgi:hypothetical protein